MARANAGMAPLAAGRWIKVAPPRLVVRMVQPVAALRFRDECAERYACCDGRSGEAAAATIRFARDFEEFCCGPSGAGPMPGARIRTESNWPWVFVARFQIYMFRMKRPASLARDTEEVEADGVTDRFPVANRVTRSCNIASATGGGP